MGALGIGYQSPGAASASALAISPTSGIVGTDFTITGAPPGATFQWTLNGSPIAGATSSSWISTGAGAVGCNVMDPVTGATATSPVVADAFTNSSGVLFTNSSGVEFTYG